MSIEVKADDKIQILQEIKENLSKHTQSGSSTDLLQSVMLACISSYKNNLEIQRELIEEVLDKNYDINNLIFNNSLYLYDAYILQYHKDLLLKHLTNPLLPENLLRVVLQLPITYELVEGQHVQNEKLSNIRKKLIEDILNEGIDLSLPFDKEEGISIIERLLQNGDFKIIEQALKARSQNNFTISIENYLGALGENFNIDFFSNFIKYFPDHQFSENQIYETMRSLGASIVRINSVIDVYKLSKDFVNVQNNVNIIYYLK
ncbi:hypothetical protein NOVO_01310 [Rickettsiales bacterium Ac37b]|nr:hypothetical protein NOVO_01310 [Rickettsiales bacterium Ac37b]